MALINCAECHAQISDQAQACVKCGAPIAMAKAAMTNAAAPNVGPNKTMPRALIAGGIIGLGIAFAGIVFIGISLLKDNDSSPATTSAQTDVIRNPDAVALKPLYHRIGAISKSINDANDQIENDYAALATQELTPGRKTELMTEIQTRITESASVTSEALSLTVPLLQDSHTSELARTYLRSVTDLIQKNQERMEAAAKGDADTIQKVNDAEPALVAQQKSSFKALNDALGVTSAQMAH